MKKLICVFGCSVESVPAPCGDFLIYNLRVFLFFCFSFGEAKKSWEKKSRRTTKRSSRNIWKTCAMSLLKQTFKKSTPVSVIFFQFHFYAKFVNCIKLKDHTHTHTDGAGEVDGGSDPETPNVRPSFYFADSQFRVFFFLLRPHGEEQFFCLREASDTQTASSVQNYPVPKKKCFDSQRCDDKWSFCCSCCFVLNRTSLFLRPHCFLLVRCRSR